MHDTHEIPYGAPVTVDPHRRYLAGRFIETDDPVTLVWDIRLEEAVEDGQATIMSIGETTEVGDLKLTEYQDFVWQPDSGGEYPKATPGKFAYDPATETLSSNLAFDAPSVTTDSITGMNFDLQQSGDFAAVGTFTHHDDTQTIFQNTGLTGATAAGTRHAYQQQFNGTPIQSVEAESDGAGGLQSPRVRRNGGVEVNRVGPKSAAYTTARDDEIVGVDSSGGTVTITLDSASAADGHRKTIKDEAGSAGTNAITVDTEGSETIDGSSSVSISSNYGSVTVYSDGTNWFTA